MTPGDSVENITKGNVPKRGVNCLGPVIEEEKWLRLSEQFFPKRKKDSGSLGQVLKLSTADA
jgi:hypothetical protein